MRLAIFSDVHGNLTALQAVLEHIDLQPELDAIVFAGDLCVFGPRPQACLDLIRQRQITSIAGNTDEWIRKPPPITDEMDELVRLHRQRLHAICHWTEQQLDQDAVDWIDSLRDSFQRRYSPTPDPAEDILIVHANPSDLNRFIFPSTEQQLKLYDQIRQEDDELAPIVGQVKAAAIAFGHLHVPNVRRWRDKILVNVSSVSLPGDGDARAKYAILTWRAKKGWSAQHFFVPYPIEAEIEAFLKTQPPFWEDNIQKLKNQGYIPQVV